MSAGQQQGRRSLLRALLLVVLVVTLPGLLLVATATWLGNSVSGSQWLARQATRYVPQLSLEIEGGSLAAGLQIKDIAWREQSWQLQATQLELSWRPSCLLASRICLSSLRGDRVVITVSDRTGPAELLPVSTPVALLIGELELGEIVYERGLEQALTLQGITARGLTWRDYQVAAKDLKFLVNDNLLQLAGKLKLRGDYPLSLAAIAELPQFEQPLQAELGGSVRSIAFTLRGIEGLPLQITGELAPLEANFPLQAQVTAQQPFSRKVGNVELQVLALDARLRGDITALAVSLDARLSEPGLGQVPVSARGRWQDGHIQLDASDWQLGDYPLQASGELTWGSDQAPLLRQLLVVHEQSRLELSGDLQEQGLDWQLHAANLSDYVAGLAGELQAQGRVQQSASGLLLSVAGATRNLLVAGVKGAAAEIRCLLPIGDSGDPLELTCSKLQAEVPQTDWLPASEWGLQAAPTKVARWQRGQLELLPLCWVEASQASVRLCLTEPLLWSAKQRSSLHAALTGLPLRWLDRIVPGNASLTGDADIELALASSDVPMTELSWRARVGEFGDVAGSLELGPGGALRIRGNDIDLAPLLPLYPELGQLAGTMALDIGVSQRDAGPWITGQLQIGGARLGIVGQTGLLASSLVELRLQGEQAVLSGEVAAEGGPAQLSGQIDWSGPQWLANIGLRAEQLELSPLPGFKLTVVPELTLQATPKSAHLSGDIFIPSGVIDLSHLSGSPDVVTISADTEIVGQAPRTATGPPFSAAVTVRLGDAVRFRGYGLIGFLVGSVQLQQLPSGPLLARGSINVNQGRWRAYGQGLIVEQGRLEFSGPLDEPYLRLRAAREQGTGDAIVGVIVDGPLADPRVRLFSSEAMSEQERMHYLLTGRRMDAAGSSTDGIAAQAALALGLASTNQALGQAAEEFGIQGFALGTEMGERGQEAQVSGYFGPNLYLKYGYSLFEPGTAFSARYRMTERFYIEGYQSTSSALNLLWYIRRRQNDPVEIPEIEGDAGLAE